MLPGPGRRAPVQAILLVALVLFLTLGAGPASAVEPLELGDQASDALSRLQRQWLEWLSTYYQGDEERASRALEGLLAEVNELGMERLPGPSLAAAAAAVDSASQGDFVRARMGLEAAELLDPGRPEAAFAGGRVARRAGKPLEALGYSLRGYLRVLAIPIPRFIWSIDVGLWLLRGLTISALCLIALLTAVRGRYPTSDLLLYFSGFVPRPVAVFLVVVVLCWPAVLPSGPLWLALYWSFILWSYISTEERAVIVSVVALLAVTPLLVDGQRRRVEVVLNPAFSSAQALAEGRLEGSFISDLNELRRLLPDSVAVTHLLGDVHSRMGQWGEALDHYTTVLDAEPENEAALVDAGASYFHGNDYGRAIESFSEAAEMESGVPSAYFNLSQAYSEQYRFARAGEALRAAQDLDDTAVAEWIKLGDAGRVVTLNAGFSRLPEIGRELREVRSEQDSRLRAWSLRHLLGMTPMLVAFLLSAVGLRYVRRKIRGRERDAAPAASLARSRWLDVAIPGWPEAEAGAWGWAFLAVLPAVLLLTLPLSVDLGYRTPVGFYPGPEMLWVLAGIGLAIYYLARLYSHMAR